MAKILISGGSGLIGKALINKLTEDGHDVSILTRQPLKNNAVKSYFWDIEHFKIDENAFDSFGQFGSSLINFFTLGVVYK